MDPLTAEQAHHTPEQPPRLALLNTDQLLDWIAEERDRRETERRRQAHRRHLERQRAERDRYLGRTP